MKTLMLSGTLILTVHCHQIPETPHLIDKKDLLVKRLRNKTYVRGEGT
jgi:hypothetical protein